MGQCGYGTTAGHTLESAMAMLSKSVTSVFTKRSPSDGGMIRSSVHPGIVTAIHSSNTHLHRNNPCRSNAQIAYTSTDAARTRCALG